MQPYHGGYYVNIGQLEFKKVETVDENSEAEELRVSKKRVNIYLYSVFLWVFLLCMWNKLKAMRELFLV